VKVSHDHRKQSFYFPTDLLEQVQAESDRQERSMSWLVQQAWKIALPTLRKLPGAAELIKATGT
jgi:uncharacterized small protein (TIGR04563 family)